MDGIDSQFTSALYAAAAGDADLATPITRLQHAMGAKFGLLWLRDMASLRVDQNLCSPNADPDPLRDYVERLHLHDPTARSAANRPAFSIFASDELVERSVFVRSLFYSDFMHRCGVDRFIGSWAPLSTGTMTAVAFHRGEGSEPFGEHERKIFAHAMPHVAAAMELRARLGGGSGLQSLVENHVLPAFVIDGTGKVILCNKAGEKLVAAQLVQVRRGRICAIEPEDRAPKPVLFRAGTRVLLSNAEPPVFARAFALQAPHTRGNLLLEVLVSSARTFHLPLARQHFRLTLTESRVAEGIAEGRSIEQVAEDLGVKESTIRSHLKALFGKTGTNRQAELAAKLAAFRLL